MKKRCRLRIAKEYFLLIQSGKKTAEVRTLGRWTKGISTGTTIVFWNPHLAETCERKVTIIQEFDSFEKMYAGPEGGELAKKVHPDHDKETQQTMLKSFYPSLEGTRVLVFHLAPVNDPVANEA